LIAPAPPMVQLQSPACMPGRTRPGQEYVGVPYPGTDLDPTPAERLMCSLTVTLDRATQLAIDGYSLIKKDFDPVNPLLAARTDRALGDLNGQLRALRPAFESRRAEGEQLITALYPPGTNLIEITPTPGPVPL